MSITLLFGKAIKASIRLAELNDMKAIERIYKENQQVERANKQPSALGSPYYQADRDYIQRAKAGEDRYQVIVAEKEGEVVGYARALHLLDKKPNQEPPKSRHKQTTLHKLGVLPISQNDGIGSQLMEAVIDKAKALKREVIRISLPHGNPFGFYKKFNFEIVKTIPAQENRRALDIVELTL